MKLYIFNKQDGSQSADFYESEVTEDILWSGDSWEQFEQETGLTEAEIGGIIRQNNKLVFSIEKKAESVKARKEILSGNEIINLLRTRFDSFTYQQRKKLINAVNDDFTLLQGINKIKESDLQEIIISIKEAVTNKNLLTSSLVEQIEQELRNYITSNFRLRE